MSRQEGLYPNEANLGSNCMFWSSQFNEIGCMCPNLAVQGRTSCEGIIDEVCLFLKDKRDTDKIPQSEKKALRMLAPLFAGKQFIPPDRE